jgi:NAD(P)-dependent dehydrogenase (short-subunit alcohol dehydrogenase family)
MPEARQQNRHVVVTGASSGIGRAIALRAAAEGARVSVLARRADKLEETAAAIRALGASAFVAPCDVTVPASVDAAFAAAAGAHGPVHALVAASGIGGPNTPGVEDRFDLLVATNLTGTYTSVRAAERHLAAGPERRDIVVIASVLGRFGVPGYTGYCASKAALLGLVKALALELAAGNTQVNAVCPGWVETDMAWEGIDGMAAAMGITRAEALAIAMRAVPLGRMGKPEEVAGLVAWLLSADAAGVTGQGLDSNGGAWMG